MCLVGQNNPVLYDAKCCLIKQSRYKYTFASYYCCIIFLLQLKQCSKYNKINTNFLYPLKIIQVKVRSSRRDMLRRPVRYLQLDRYLHLRDADMEKINYGSRYSTVPEFRHRKIYAV